MMWRSFLIMMNVPSTYNQYKHQLLYDLWQGKDCCLGEPVHCRNGKEASCYRMVRHLCGSCLLEALIQFRPIFVYSLNLYLMN